MSNLAYDTRTPCEQEPELFHAPDRELPGDKATREAAAKALCATCPAAVREDCLRIAMENEAGLSAGNRWGLYAGLTEQERADLDKKQKRKGPAPTAPHGTRHAYKRHQRHGETPCDRCKAANAEYTKARAAAKKENAA